MEAPTSLPITSRSDVSHAVLRIGEIARAMGFPMPDRVKLMEAVSELGTNIVRHAGGGRMVIRAVSDGERAGIEICAEDEGPGIEDSERALAEDHAPGRSPGRGLLLVKRSMDSVSIERMSGPGTRVCIRKWR